MNARELKALISLLDDSDREVFGNVREKLVSLGPEVIPELESVWEGTFNTELQQRIEEIIHHIQLGEITLLFNEWIDQGAKDLLRGIILVARYQYPDLEEDKIHQFVGRLKKDIWMEINHSQTALEQCKVFNHVFYGIHQFAANTTNYQAPENNYINKLIESKKGNAVTLAALYIVVAQSLELPVYGVNLPEHFILCWLDKSEITRLLLGKTHTPVLFYMNPLNRGAVFSRREIDAFLMQSKIEPQDNYYTPAPNHTLIIRMFNNLISYYSREGRPEKAAELSALKENILSRIEGIENAE